MRWPVGNSILPAKPPLPRAAASSPPVGAHAPPPPRALPPGTTRQGRGGGMLDIYCTTLYCKYASRCVKNREGEERGGCMVGIGSASYAHDKTRFACKSKRWLVRRSPTRPSQLRIETGQREGLGTKQSVKEKMGGVGGGVTKGDCYIV